MNCSYRILENVHIGLRVRKTKDKSTVAYHNQPITDVYIEKWNDQGFRLKHSAFPTKDNTVWLDFHQLPLNQLNIEMGYIKNPIVFVEAIANYGGGTSMVLLRADIFDYLELLDDKKQKEESKIYKPSELKPGDRVISAICKEGNVMVYLGTFNVATMGEDRRYYGYGYGRDSRPTIKYVHQTPERVFFAYESPDGKYSINSYPVNNKVVKEVYNAHDKGRGNSLDPAFTNEDANLKILNHLLFKDRNYGATLKAEYKPADGSYDNIKMPNEYWTVLIQKGKKDIRENAVNFVKTYCECDSRYVFATEEEATTYRRAQRW